MQDWESEILKLVRETYAKQGCSDVLIMVGCINENDDICTQVLCPEGTEGDFDIRLMVFHMMNHVFSEYNEILQGLKEDEE